MWQILGENTPLNVVDGNSKSNPGWRVTDGTASTIGTFDSRHLYNVTTESIQILTLNVCLHLLQLHLKAWSGYKEGYLITDSSKSIIQ